MENTLENKAKFMAQYWEQYVGYTVRKQTGKQYVGANFIKGFGAETNYVELKPLTAISEEDALQVAKFEYPTTPGFQTVEDGRLCTVHEDVQSELSQASVDYLRLNGYAVPFLDLSVGSQISYGWVKLVGVC